MSYDRNRQRPGNRRGYLPQPGHRQHSVLGYWVPLVAIGTIAVGGLAAWIWSERSEHDDELPSEKPPRPPTGLGGQYPPPPGPPNYSGPPPPGGAAPYSAPSGPPSQQQQQQPYQRPPGGEAASYYGQAEGQSRDAQGQDDGNFFNRMTGAIRRTPSPQQFFDSASRHVTSGMAAAGAALSSIMEEDKDQQGLHYDNERRDEREGFSDHERWSEEAEEKTRNSTAIKLESNRGSEASAGSARAGKAPVRAKRAVAVVISADADVQHEHDDTDFHTEHGSILSHLPTQHDPAKTDLIVLIYAPGLKSLPSTDPTPGARPASTIGSFSQISTPAVTPGSELQSISPRIDATDPATARFDALHQQALALVAHPSQVLPFTTPDGYLHMLKHLAPQLVYITDSLSGRDGHNVAQLKGWVGHTILVVGDDGHGGLADTETETEDERANKGPRRHRWYEQSPLVGLGKEIEIVDAARVGDDWARRVVG